MRKVLVFQHVAYEPLGLLDPLLRKAGIRIRYVNFGRLPDAEPGLDGYDGLIVLGGPMNVDETARLPHLDREMELIRTAVARELPVLGICLGAQLMAKALGGNVTRNPVKEIGWFQVKLTDAGRNHALLLHFAAAEMVFQWHAYAFTPPPGAVHLASGATCPFQAFSVGERAFGLQFHLEADRALIQRWLSVAAQNRLEGSDDGQGRVGRIARGVAAVAAHVTEIEELRAAGTALAIDDDTARFEGRALALGRQTFQKFIDMFGPRRRKLAFPTR